MKWRRDGVAGFFADIPALLAIIIGLSIFTFSLYSAHGSYLDRRGSEDMARRLDSFAKEFNTNSVLTSSPGVYLGEALRNLNQSDVMELYPPEALGFHYRIDFQDDSGYANGYSTSFETDKMPSQRDVFAKSTSVLITEGTGRAHLARLTFYIWRLNP